MLGAGYITAYDKFMTRDSLATPLLASLALISEFVFLAFIAEESRPPAKLILLPHAFTAFTPLCGARASGKDVPTPPHVQ